MANTAAHNYGNWLNRIDAYAIENGFSTRSMYDMDEIQQIISLYDALYSDEELIHNHKDYFVSLGRFYCI